MTTPTRSALVVADDLTGACDTVVQFARAGWDAALALDPAVPVAAEAVATCLDSRRDPRAADLTRDAVAAAEGLVYLKVDSTMRGRVADQVAGALAAHRARHPGGYLVLCPAYPAMGRTLVGGRVLVHGSTVVDSPAGRDPVTPVLTDDVAALVPGALGVPAAPAEELAATLAARGPEHGVLAVDAVTDDDLAEVARAVAGLGAAVLPAGSAGLAGPLARAWSPREARRAPRPHRDGPVLLVVSSLHDVAREQVERVRADHGEDRVRVLTTPVPHAGAEGGAEGDAAATQAEDLAARTADALGHGGHGMLVLVGGDGARAVTRALGATGVRVWGAASEGMPLGTLVGGDHEGLPVVTKAGGFGSPTALSDLIDPSRAQEAP